MEDQSQHQEHRHVPGGETYVLYPSIFLRLQDKGKAVPVK